MRKFTLFKRILFWGEASVSMVIVLLGAIIVIGLTIATVFSEQPAVTAREVVGIASYFLQPIPRLFASEPLVFAVTLFWVMTYIVTMRYFAQTALELRISKYLVPATLVCVPVCVMAGFSMVIGKLASQGAGG